MEVTVVRPGRRQAAGTVQQRFSESEGSSYGRVLMMSQPSPGR